MTIYNEAQPATSNDADSQPSSGDPAEIYEGEITPEDDVNHTIQDGISNATLTIQQAHLLTLANEQNDTPDRDNGSDGRSSQQDE